MEFMSADVSEKDVSKWESPSLAKHLFTISAHVVTKYLQWGFVPTVIYLGMRNGADPLPNGEIPQLSLFSVLW